MSKDIAKGMSVSDIMSLDIQQFNSIPLSDMKVLVSRLASAGNKRLAIFEKQSKSSPAYRYIQESGGKFSVAGKNLNQLRTEYMRVKSFLTSKTGSVRGWHTVVKETIGTLADRGVTVSKENFDRMWQVYGKLSELDPNVKTAGMKYETLREINNMLINDTRSVDDIIMDMESRLAAIYEAQQDDLDDEEFSMI